MFRIFLILSLFVMNSALSFAQENEQNLQTKYQQYEQDVRTPDVCDTFSNNYYFFGQDQGMAFKYFFTQYQDDYYRQQERADRKFYLRNKPQTTFVSSDEYRIFK